MYDFGHDYPYLDGIKCDKRLIRFAERARENELCDICEYVCRSAAFESSCPELAELYKSLAMDEMKHFYGLSRMLYCAGASPCVRADVRPMRLGLNPVCTEKGKLIASDIADEKSAEKKYLGAAAHTGDPSAANFFINLADDEARHAKLLCEARERESCRRK